MSVILPTDEVYINLTTVARVNAARGVTSDLNLEYSKIMPIIRRVSRTASKMILKRVVKKDTYIERFDVLRNQKNFWVSASPIVVATDIDTDITIYNNTDQPRVFTNSVDEIDADYIICDPARRKEGRITIEDTLSPDVDALQITYTGGMASSTVISGSDGVCAASRFTSAATAFTTLGVAVGDLLAIKEVGDGDHGVHRITAVGANYVDVAVAFTGTSSALDFEIIDGGNDTIVGLYPDIADAIDQQVIKMLKNSGNLGIKSQSSGGETIQYYNPESWDSNLLAALNEEARRI